MSLGRIPVRLRLALGAALTFGALLAAVGTLVQVRHASDLDATIDQDLAVRAAALADAAGGGHADLAATPLGERDEALAAIATPAGAVVDATANVDAAALRRALGRAGGRGPRLVDAALPGFDHGVRLRIGPLGDGRVGVVGTALADRDEALASLRRDLLVAAPLAAVCAGLLAWAFAAAALRPVERMRARAAGISAGSGASRLPLPPADDELRRLAGTLNAMIARLQDAAARERRLVADASHELRTPLALLRTEIDLALDGASSREELLAALRAASRDVDRLAALVDDLLLLARADDERLDLDRRELHVGGLLAHVAERFATAARAAGRRLDVDAAPGLAVLADGGALERALGNLVGNALQHGAGAVVLEAEVRTGSVVLHVRDEGGGSGVPERLFERFHRGAGATGDGAGLGLAIVAAIARAHGGSAGAAARPGCFDAWLLVPAAYGSRCAASGVKAGVQTATYSAPSGVE